MNGANRRISNDRFENFYTDLVLFDEIKVELYGKFERSRKLAGSLVGSRGRAISLKPDSNKSILNG